MKIYLALLSILYSFNLCAQKEYLSAKGVSYRIVDSKNLDSRDGGALITNGLDNGGYRPFSYISSDSTLTNVSHGIYYLKVEDALCGYLLDTIEIKSENNTYASPEGILVGSVDPNPFIDEINIVVDSDKEQEIRIQLFNVSGELAFRRNVSSVKGIRTIKVGDITVPAGVYIIQICDSHNCQLTDRLIKVNY